MMFIGSCRDCNDTCMEGYRNTFDRTHEGKKHRILEAQEFIRDNDAFIEKVQNAWKPFDNNLQQFFKSLRNKLDKIEKDAYERIIEEELKTAVNSNDNRTIQLARSVLNQKFKHLKCRDIEEFLQIKKRQEESPNLLSVQKKQQDFAFDILDQIKRSAYDLGKSLHDTNNKRKLPIETKGKRQEVPIRQEQKKKQVVPERENRRDNERPVREDRDRRARRQEPKQDKRQDRRVNRQDRQKRDGAQNANERRPRQQRQARQTRQHRQPRQRQHRQDVRERRQPRRRDRDEREPRKTDEKHQKNCKKVKISQLKQSDDEFSVDFKLIKFIKVVRGRDLWLVGDETGEIELVIPNHQSFKPEVAITLNNCYVKDFHGQLQLYAKLFSTITSRDIGNEVDVGALQKNKNRQFHQRKKQTAPIAITKISTIQPGLQNMKLIAKVVSVLIKGQFALCVLGDDTGIVNARFKKSEFLKEDSSIYCRGVQADVDGQKEGPVVLLEGSRFMIEYARQPMRRVNKEMNISERIYTVQEE